MEIKKYQLQTLNNLVFRIAKKQNDTEYRTIMKFSKKIASISEEFQDEQEIIRLKFATKLVEGQNERGQKYEYNIVPAEKEAEYIKALKAIANEYVDLSILSTKEQSGFDLFLLEIGKLTKDDLVKVEDNKIEYTYQDQLLINDLL